MSGSPRAPEEAAARVVPLLAGPTGIGKTALALELARRIPCGIISADSMQMYRGMAIGTAQPTADEQALARELGSPFQLCGELEPTAPFDARMFVERCAAAHAAIAAAGKLPVYVGGTGMYLRALRWGLIDDEARDEALRAKLQAEVDEHGAAALHARLNAADPEAAARIMPTDALRIVRALEGMGATGRRWSELQAQWRTPRPRFAHLLIVLHGERGWLRERIAQRTRAMLQAGWIEETEALLAAGVPRTQHCFKALGYREILDYLEGAFGTGERAREALAQRIIDQTRQFARRQLIWLRRERPALWLPADAGGPQALAATVQNLLANAATRFL